ncbi:MAG: SPOR domain-containing protein [Candidatus Omnitrophota bacterium]
MDHKNGAQLELFRQSSQELNAKNAALSTSLLKRLRNHEKAILAIIAIVTLGIISYIKGVEKGIQLAQINPAAIPAKKVIVAASMAPTPKPNAAIRPAFNAPAYTGARQPLNTQRYTIQLASFKGREYAQTETERLKRKGLAAFVLTKGEYMVLCMGNFPTKEAAQTALPEIKKYYAGCQIRRL